jgi:hypothetical protein
MLRTRFKITQIINAVLLVVGLSLISASISLEAKAHCNHTATCDGSCITSWYNCAKQDCTKTCISEQDHCDVFPYNSCFYSYCSSVCGNLP